MGGAERDGGSVMGGSGVKSAEIFKMSAAVCYHYFVLK